MKKNNQTSPKLSLAKRTIANLHASEMNQRMGGDKTNGNCAGNSGACAPWSKKCRPSW